MSDEQAQVWEQLIAGTLPPADTWEVALSGGADKREAFTRLLQENKLGYLALLRNLRKMAEVGVDAELIEGAIMARRGAERVLPFRYVAALRAAPQFYDAIDCAFTESLQELPPLSGTTLVLVDVSGSMNDRLSARSDLTRMDAAAALATMVRPLRDGDSKVQIFTFSEYVKEITGDRTGLRMIDAICNSQPHNGTRLHRAVAELVTLPHDRLIVISDEQAHAPPDSLTDRITPKGYMINVASARNGVGYGERWVHLDGFSEKVLRWIAAFEGSER